MPEGIWLVAYVGLWVLLLGQTVMLLFVSRHMANLYHMRSLFPDRGVDASQEGLPLGTEAPQIEVMDLGGQPVRLGGPAPRKRLLVFLAPHCPACRAAIRPLHMARTEGAEMVLL